MPPLPRGGGSKTRRGPSPPSLHASPAKGRWHAVPEGSVTPSPHASPAKGRWVEDREGSVTSSPHASPAKGRWHAVPEGSVTLVAPCLPCQGEVARSAGGVHHPVPPCLPCQGEVARSAGGVRPPNNSKLCAAKPPPSARRAASLITSRSDTSCAIGAHHFIPPSPIPMASLLRGAGPQGLRGYRLPIIQIYALYQPKTDPACAIFDAHRIGFSQPFFSYQVSS